MTLALAVACTSADRVLIVDGGTRRAMPFVAKFDDEYVMVTGGAAPIDARPYPNPTTYRWEVERGVLGSNPAAHAIAAEMTVDPSIGGGLSLDNGVDAPVPVTTLVAPGATIDGDAATLGKWANSDAETVDLSVTAAASGGDAIVSRVATATDIADAFADTTATAVDGDAHADTTVTVTGEQDANARTIITADGGTANGNLSATSQSGQATADIVVSTADGTAHADHSVSSGTWRAYGTRTVQSNGGGNAEADVSVTATGGGNANGLVSLTADTTGVASGGVVATGDGGSAHIKVEADATSGRIGFFTAAPVAKPTGVAVTAEAIHAALVTLGLIAA